jgi:Domain of unknown function (DUF5667)
LSSPDASGWMNDRSPDPADELDALLDGRRSDVPEELAPLVEAAQRLRAAMLAHELDAAVAAAHLARIQERIQGTGDAREAVRRHRRWRWRLRVIAIGLAVAVALIPAFMAAGAAVPGDGLYPLKRAVEWARLATAVTPERQAAERTRLAVRRCEEFEQLTTAGHNDRLRAAKVELRRSLVAARAAIASARVRGAKPATVAKWRAQLAEVEQDAKELGIATADRARSVRVPLAEQGRLRGPELVL